MANENNDSSETTVEAWWGLLATTSHWDVDEFGDAPMRGDSKSVDEIFENELIFGKVADYLGVSDLKILRQTSRSMLERVKHYKRFTNNLRITICKESIEEGVIAQSIFPWKNAKLLMKGWQPLEEAKRCLRDVEDLEVRTVIECLSPPSSPIVYQHRYFDSEHCVHQICELLPQMEKLKSLSLPVEFFKCNLIISKASEKLRTLESFSVHGENTFFGDVLRPESEFQVILRNWEDVGSLNWNLKSLQVNSTFCNNYPFPSNPTVANILRRSADTLETIKLSCRNSRIFVGSFDNLVFPSLKSIQYTIQPFGDGQRFATFLRNQPDLESIELNVNVKGSQRISPEVLDAIREKSAELKTLILRGTNVNWCDSFPESFDWEFLKDCKNLKEFHIPGGKTKFDVGEIYAQPWIQSLPSKIRSIQLFNLTPTDGLNPIFLMERFSQLTQLKFTCETVLNDELLQSICVTNTALRVFHFGIGFVNLTNFGITGEREDGTLCTGISLKNMKGLQELTIFGRGRLTDEGLVKAFQFEELKQLTLIRTEIMMSEEAILEIAKNNPSLEFLSCRIDFPRQRETLDVAGLGLFCKIRAINKRLTKLGGQWNDCSRFTHKPSYGIPSMAADSEFGVSKNEFGHCVFSIGGSAV